MDKARICRVLEILRWVGVGIGIFLALLLGEGPVQQFSILCGWVVISLAGLTGIESVFFAQAASQISGYGYGGAYQRQSGLNNLALAVTTILVYALNWGFYAKITVMCVMLIFLTFSASNHAYSAIKEHNRSLRNFLRPIMTAVLLSAMIPFMVQAISASTG